MNRAICLAILGGCWVGFLLVLWLSVPIALDTFRDLWQRWRLHRSWVRHCRENGLDPDRAGGMIDFPCY